MAPKASKQPAAKRDDGVNVLEEGHLFFFYRPKVEQESPESIDDIQRLMLVMRPSGGSDIGPQGEEAIQDDKDEENLKRTKEEHLEKGEGASEAKDEKDGAQGENEQEEARPAKKAKTEEPADEVTGTKPVHPKDLKNRLRYIVVGKKALPQVTGKKSRPFWAFVKYVTDDPEVIRQQMAETSYETKTRGTRHQPGSRPCGEGVYKITAHHAREHTHLAYKLELPSTPGDVQKELNIEPEASFVIQVKNPDSSAPAFVGLGNKQKAEYPENLKRVFHERRFVSADPPDLLDYPGCEFILISASDDIEADLGIDVKKAQEKLESSDLVSSLRLEKDLEKVRKPLLEGEWA